MSTDRAVVLLVQDGVVGGGSVMGAASGADPRGRVRGDPTRATGPPPAGSYDLWVSWSREVTAPSHGLGTSVAGPWTIRLG